MLKSSENVIPELQHVKQHDSSEEGAEEIKRLVFSLYVGAERRRNELLRVLDPLHRIKIAEKNQHDQL